MSESRLNLYLSGPIKGVEDPQSNFATAAIRLLERGYSSVNPFDCEPNCAPWCPSEDSEEHYDCFMRGDIAQMMRCDGVALLTGWERSRGARLEHAIALQTGMPAHPLMHWVNGVILPDGVPSDIRRIPAVS